MSSQVSEIRKRLMTVIHLQGFAVDREIVATATVNLVLPEIVKIVKDELKKAASLKKQAGRPPAWSE